LGLPDDDPVYTMKKVMEELDFSGLLANCSDKGRNGYNPIMMYAVVTYANMRGIRAVDRIVELCERDLAFIWLTKGQKPKRDAFYGFKNKKLTSDVLDELNYQFLRRLQKEGLVTLKSLLCAYCSGCEHKAKCLYKYNAEKDAGKNKVMKINEQWETLKEESHANIQSEKGILNRQIRSIQTEGHFGDIKENDSFRRFNYRTSEKVYKEFMLYAIGRNINKYHRFLHDEIKKFEGKTEEKAA